MCIRDSPYRFREVEHTADRALWVWGAELPALFVGAARGMYSLMDEELGDRGLVPTRWRNVALEVVDREDVLDKLLATWGGESGREIASSVAMALGPVLDYQFLLTLSNRLEQTTDEATRANLEELRGLVIDMQEQQQQNTQSGAAQAQEVLQAVLEADDVDAALAQYGDMIDETFLGLLANSIDRAEKSGATAAVRRLESRQLPGVRCFYFDSIGVPSEAVMTRDYGGPEAWLASVASADRTACRWLRMGNVPRT